jgi:hypothetical protein
VWVDHLIHEISHALVFNPELAKHYRDPNGVTRGENKVIKKNEDRKFIILPKIKSEAEKYFDCKENLEITGVPLENYL